MRKRVTKILVCTVVVLVMATQVLSGCNTLPTPTPVVLFPTPTPTSTATASPEPTVTPYPLGVAFKIGIGNYLVDARGITLYYNLNDSPGVSNVTGSSLQNWTPFTETNLSLPPPLNQADLGTTNTGYGRGQTTYQGWPLYYYNDDKVPGDTLGNGVDGIWSIIIIPAA